MKTRQHGQKGRITAETHHQLYDLYWNENFEQHGLSQIFQVDQGHISRMVNSKAPPYQATLFTKQLKCERAIKPAKREAIQATTMRAKREILPTTKLTWKKVCAIREEYFAGLTTQVKLAQKYKVNQSTMSRILSGKKWKKVK